MEPKNTCFPSVAKINVMPFPYAPKERHFYFFVFLPKRFFSNQEKPFNTGTESTSLPFLSIKLFIKQSCFLCAFPLRE